MTGRALAILAAVVLIGAAIATYFLAGWPTARENEDAARAIVQEFGSKLKQVNVLADKTLAADAMAREYGPLVAPALLTKWQNDPTQAPGRLSSSPWPDRIDITSSERESRSRYVFEGVIVELTNEGGADVEPVESVRRPIVLAVEEQGDSWRITEVVLGAFPGEAKWISSMPTEQGFLFLYPERLPTTFISAEGWPPTIERTGTNLSCKESTGTNPGEKATAKHTVGTQDYCVTKSSEGAAGSIYETYEYTFKVNGAAYRLGFTLRLPQCENYDEPQKGACKAEQSSFNVDSLVDRIAQSIQVVPEK